MAETLKINYILDTMGRTGGVRVLLNFARALSSRGHQITITNSWKHGAVRLPSEIRIVQLPRLRFYRYIFGEYYMRPSLARMARHWQITAEKLPRADIHVATHWTTVYPALLAPGESARIYQMLHFETLLSDHPLKQRLARLTYSLPLYQIANSSWLADRILELTGNRPELVNPGMEHENFYPRGGQARNADIIRIVTLGKRGWKNLDLVIEAVRRCVDNKSIGQRIELHVFGTSLPRRISTHPFVHLHRNLTDDQLAELYSSCQIQVTASTAESFPLPPLEAMACGCCVITTPFGTEDYAFDGRNCLTTEPGSVDDLASKLQLLILHPGLREVLTRAGLETASRFRYDTQAQILEDVMKRALDTQRSGESTLRKKLSRYGIPLG